MITFSHVLVPTLFLGLYFFVLKMGEQTSVDTREIAMKWLKDGKTLREIGDFIGRNHNTIKKIIHKYKKTGQLQNIDHPRRPRRLNNTQTRSKVRTVNANPFESAV